MAIASVVHPWCQKVLPLTYDDSLSYMEMVEKLRYKVNEMIDLFNEWETIILELQQALVDIPQMKEDIERLRIDVDLNKATLTLYGERLDALEKGVAENSTDIVELHETVNGLRQWVEDTLNSFMKEVDTKINNITFGLDEEIHLLAYKINQIKVDLYAKYGALVERMDAIDTAVLNPWWQELGRLTQDENMKKVYYDLADNVPTSQEYCKLGLTADEYKAFGLNARQYARNGKKLLHFYWVYNPVDGYRQEISNVLTALVDDCKGTMTAEQYKGGDLTAEDYTRLNLTAYQYYSFSPERLGIFESNGVLQSEQYAITETDGVAEISGADWEVVDGVLQIRE